MLKTCLGSSEDYLYVVKVGPGPVGTYLARIGVLETPECWWCKETVQSVEHLYT